MLIRIVPRFENAGKNAVRTRRSIALTTSYKLPNKALMHELNHYGLPNVWMGDAKNRRHYDPTEDKVLLVTRQSSKGLEFPRVIVAGLGSLKDDEDKMLEEARLLYVAMTRAQECLLLTASANNSYVQRFVASGN